MVVLGTLITLPIAARLWGKQEPGRGQGVNVQHQEVTGKVQDFSRLFNVDQVVEMGPIKVGVVNIGLVKNTVAGEDDFKGHIALGLEVANTAPEMVRFYPEQFVIYLNTGERLSSDISISSDIGGVFTHRRVKKGFVLFPIKDSEPDEINELVILMVAPENENHQPLCENQELAIPL